MQKLTVERTFAAPIEKVWEAWTNPKLLAKWFAPAGMTNSLATTKVKVGGVFRYCFVNDKSGTQFYGRGVYKKIVPSTFLSYLDSFTDEDGNDVAASHYGIPGDEIVETLIEISLTEMGRKTKMTLVMDNYYDESMTKDMVSNWNIMFDKLSSMNKISVETTVNAPMEEVWEYWINPAHISRWAFASDDWEAIAKTNDLRVGGQFETRMQAKDGSEGFDMTGVYTSVKKHELIEYNMEDGRNVAIVFEKASEGIKVTEIFDADNEYSEEQQRFGWQAILDNFKKYVELDK